MSQITALLAIYSFTQGSGGNRPLIMEWEFLSYVERMAFGGEKATYIEYVEQALATVRPDQLMPDDEE